MVWFPFATEEPQSSDVDSGRARTKTHKRDITPIIISAHDDSSDDSSDDSLTSLPNQPGLSSLPEKVDVSDARGDNVVRHGAHSEIRETSSSPQRFNDKDIAEVIASRDSGIDELFYDTAIIVRDESHASDMESRGELICIVRPSSSSSKQTSSDASQNTNEETIPNDMTQEGDALEPQTSVSLENDDEKPATTAQAGELRAIGFGKIMSKATASYGKRMSKVVSSRLECLKEKRRKNEEQDKILSHQLQSLRSKRKKVAAPDQILDEMEQTMETPLENKVVSTVPIRSNVKASVENDGIELNLNGSNIEGKASGHSLLKASSTFSATPPVLEKQSDDETSQTSHTKIMLPPFMVNMIAPDVSLRTIGVIPEPLSSDGESVATNPANSDSSEVSPLWSFIACCSVAYFFSNNGDSSQQGSDIQDSALPPTEGELVKKVEPVEKSLSISNNGSNANTAQQTNEHAPQGEVTHSISPPKETSVRESSSGSSREVVSRASFKRIASEPKLEIMETESSFAIKSKPDDEVAQTSVEKDVDESLDEDECKMMMTASSLEKKTSNDEISQRADSRVTEASDARTGLLSLIESDTDMTSFDSQEISLPWWQKEDINSVDSQGWILPYIADPDGEPGSMIDGIWTVPTLTEYSQANLMVSESQFSTLSFESDGDFASTASSCELAGAPTTESASKDSASVASEQDIEQVMNHEISADQEKDEEKARDRLTKDSNDTSHESNVNGENQEQKESSRVMETSTCSEHRERPDDIEKESVSEPEMSVAGNAHCVERKRVRVFSKALSQSVARNIQRRASKMKSKKATRRNEALLVKSGLSVDEELPAIEETNESSNASTTSSLGVETQVTWTKSGIEVDEATVLNADDDTEAMGPPSDSAVSPKSVFDIKLPREIQMTVASDQSVSVIPSVTSRSFNDASNGELELYMV